ncbi:uncharacterized protein LOC134751399 isoform X2 [Cydia strobilella]
MECNKPITGFGFQWWCLQCDGLRCGVCALRMVHRPHFLLRSPANTTPEQIQILIAAIQKELQLEDFFNTRDADKHADNVESADVDLDVIEESLQEPTVKAEPPEEAEDPLAECSNYSFILKSNETPTNNYYTKDHQPISQNCRPNPKYGLSDSLNTHDEDMVLGLRGTDYQPSEKSLDLVKPFEYQRNLQYLGLGKPLEIRASQSSGLEDSIEYRPSKKSVCLESIDYQVSQTPECTLESQDWIDYQPSKKSVCHEPIVLSSQTSTGLDNSEHRQKILDFDDFYGNFGLYTYDQPDIADIRHSASLQAAPKGPDRAQSPKPNNIELSGPSSWATDKVPNMDSANMEFSGSCTLATDRVPNTDPTGMELSGSCLFGTDEFPDTDPTGMELSGSGYESDGSSVQLETLVPNDQHPRDEDIHPPCNKRVRVQTSTENVENDLVNTTTPQAIEIKNISQQPEQVTLIEDETEYTKNKEPKISSPPQPLCQVYFENKKTDHIKTQQPEVQAHSTHKKQNCAYNMEQKNDHNKQKSVNTKGKLKNTHNRTQQPRIYATSTKQGFENNAVQTEKHNKQKTVKTIEDPNYGPLKTQLPEILADSTHKGKNSTDATEEQNNKSETRQPPIKVYSKKRSCTNTIEQKENKLKSTNTIGDPEKDPNKTKEPDIKIYTTNKKQTCKNITEPEDDNSITQEPKMQVYSTHKKRNFTDTTEHRNNPKPHISVEMNLTHKDMKSREITEQNKDSNKIQETQIHVYSTHKARNSKHCRKRKYS